MSGPAEQPPPPRAGGTRWQAGERPLRVYADTSVFGGVFDEEFARGSRAFFRQVKSGDLALVTSAFVQDEMREAPPEVQELFAELLPLAELAYPSPAADDLRAAYVEAEIVGPKYATDAMHVAMATVARCEVIVSWNFRHIVHFRKVRLYNAVNALQGYPSISIHSPLELVEGDGDEET